MTATRAPKPAVSAEPEYDIAISFLASDQKIADELVERLGESLKVFYFPRTQDTLAGTDGMESMRIPFVSESRVSAILYREPWGETPWTRVEAAAIKDGCLARGWTTLMFVQLDKTSTLPRWLPNTHIRYALADYGVDQLVGAIKLKVQEHGAALLGSPTPPAAPDKYSTVQSS